MVRVVQREIRKRGFFGWIFLLIFFGFNGAMALWLFWYWRLISSETEGARAGGAFFGIIGGGTLLFLWAAGALITGAVALVARGRKKAYIEKVSERPPKRPAD